jgi:tRNA G18 (ribose-2'-O)-methylase SpoU
VPKPFEPVRIESADDERIVDYVGLRDRKESDQYLIAETAPVVERLLASTFKVRSFLLTEKGYARLKPAIDAATLPAPVYLADREVMEQITGFDIHRGVLASARRPSQRTLGDLLSRSKRIIILEGSNDHENIGVVARSARALGFDAMVLDPSCADPYYRRAVRVSMGEIFHLPITRCTKWPEPLEFIAQQGYETWALTPDPDAENLFTMGMPDKVALLAGAEGPGLTPMARARTHYDVRIPMHHGVDSLNLGHALAIAMAAVSPPVAD